MKSRKLRAVFAALSAIAVLATAMTGFAATVTTTATYNADADYVHVTSTVTGANGDVTYLATTSDEYGVNSSGILYIDQKEATGASIEFDYYVDKDVIDGAVSSVVLGTNGTASIEQPNNGIGIKAANTVDAEGYTVTFKEDYYGGGDGSLTAYVEAKPGYELEEVYINGEAVELAASYSVPVLANGNRRSITAKVEQTYVTPSETHEYIYGTDVNGNNTLTAVFAPVGTYTEVGVTYYGYEFPAPMAGGNGYTAVQIVDDMQIYEEFLGTYIK